MKNNDKLKRNFLQNGVSKIGSKITKILPKAFLAATMLNCATAAAQTKAQQPIKAPTPVYREAAINRFDANPKSFEKIYNSKLFNMNKYDTLEKQVHIDLATMLVNMNQETIRLSTAYKAMEIQSTINSNLTNEEINQISSERGAKTSDTKNMSVAKISTQHLLHLILDTLTLIRLGGEEAQISILDEHNDANQNEYLRFNTKGPRDIRTESEIVLNLGLKDISAFAGYVYNVAGQNGDNVAALINSNFMRIKELITHPGQSKAEYNSIMALVEQTANLLPESLFGNREMRKALVLEYTKQYTINATMDKSEKIGYTVKDFKAEDIMNRVSVKLDTAEFRVEGTPEGATFSTGVDAKVSSPVFPVDFKFGGEVGYKTDNSFQVLAKADPGVTFKNGSRLSTPLKGGINVAPGTNIPVSGLFGAGLMYKLPINNVASIDFSGSTIFNFQKQTVEAGGMIGVSFDTKKIRIRVGLGFGKTFKWENSSSHSGGIVNPGNTPVDPGKIPDNPGQKPDDPKKPDDNPNKDPEQPEIKNPDGLHITTPDIPPVEFDPSKLLK